ncbi:MAG TPA: ABC transporter permease [Ilumatobacter sp.]|nr:ABC transporter permease [Ilumatobacter sp.]
MIEAIAVGAVRGGTSLVFAGVGETICERSGILNLGVEGSMLVGALTAYAVGIETGSPTLGALMGAVAGCLLAMVHGLLVLVRKANQVASGLAITFLGIGVTALFGQSYVSQGVEAFDRWAIPGLSDIPFVGPVFFDHDPLTYLSFLLVPVAWWFLFRSGPGLKLRAAGERPAVLDTMGIKASTSQWMALAVGGALSGLGGAQLSTAFARTWSENMVAGRGFIAVALVIFAAWNPALIMAGAYLFSGAVALELELQARGTNVSIFILDSIPYAAVIIVLSLLSRRRRHAAPESLSKVFDANFAST